MMLAVEVMPSAVVLISIVIVIVIATVVMIIPNMLSLIGIIANITLEIVVRREQVLHLVRVGEVVQVRFQIKQQRRVLSKNMKQKRISATYKRIQKKTMTATQPKNIHAPQMILQAR